MLANAWRQRAEEAELRNVLQCGPLVQWCARKRPGVRFELTEQTRQAVDGYLKAAGKKPGDFLFTRRRSSEQGMTTRQYARLVSEWIAGSGWT